MSILKAPENFAQLIVHGRCEVMDMFTGYIQFDITGHLFWTFEL